MTASPTCLFVLGMHRSGTSAVTRMLNLLGAGLSRELEQARDDNPGGFWEARRLRELDDAILACVGLRWDSLAPLPPDWQEQAARAGLAQQCRRLLSEECAGARLSVLKDPRICRLFPLWRRAAVDLGIAPAAVLPLRDPREVAASLRARDGMATGRGLVLWLLHVLAAEAASRGLPRVFLTYDELLADWRMIARRCATGLGLDWFEPPASACAAIDSFLQPAMRHQRPGDAAKDAATIPLIEPVWAALLRLCTDQDDPQAQRELDDAAAELAGTAPLLAAWEADTATATSLRTDNQQVRDRLAAVEQELTLRRAQEPDLRRLEAAHARQREQWTATARRLAAIETSASWTLATPMRALERRFPRLLRRLVEPPRRLAWRFSGHYAERAREARHERLIVDAGLFDGDAYLDAHPEAAGDGMSPLRHWLRHGWRQGWDPHPGFDTQWYLRRYGHLLPPDHNPLVDYLTIGKTAGRQPLPPSR